MGKVAVIVPAGGAGRRMGGQVPKQFLEIIEKPILGWTLNLLANVEAVQDIILVVPETWIETAQSIVLKFNIPKIKAVCAGGERRQDSVANGMAHLSPDTEIVLVHDAVRPLVSPGKILDVIEASFNFGAAVLAVPLKDTLKSVESGIIEKTVDRKHLWRIQTPQGFRVDWLRKAYKKLEADSITVTDDSELVQRLGHPVHIVEGEEQNIKITTPEDMQMAVQFLKEKS